MQNKLKLQKNHLSNKNSSKLLIGWMLSSTRPFRLINSQCSVIFITVDFLFNFTEFLLRKVAKRPLQTSEMESFVTSERLLPIRPSRPSRPLCTGIVSCIGIKINLNFYFHFFAKPQKVL